MGVVIGPERDLIAADALQHLGRQRRAMLLHDINAPLPEHPNQSQRPLRRERAPCRNNLRPVLSPGNPA